MRVLFVLFVVCALSGCEPVDFIKPSGVSLLDRVRAVDTLRLNAAAFSEGDIDTMEATMHPDAPSTVDAQALFDRYAPKMDISDVKFVSESSGAVVFEYSQMIQSTRATLPATSARVRTELRRMPKGWGIVSSDVLSLSR